MKPPRAAGSRARGRGSVDGRAALAEAPAPEGSGLELTPRAVAAGCAIGALLAVGNVYMGLKTGFWESGTILSSVLAFSLVTALSRAGSAPYTALENNLAQTTAALIGAMPAAAGLLSTVPALALGGERAPGWGVVPWAVALGGLGVLVAHALRKRLLEAERLPFPTGVATAEVINALHRPGEASPGRARAVLGAGAGAMALTWLRDAARWVPAFTPLPGRVLGLPAGALTLGLNWSPVLVAIGALVGPLNGLSMLLGAVLAWGVLAPELVRAGICQLQVEGNLGLAAWLIWPGVGLLVGATLASLLGQARAFAGMARDVRALRRVDFGAGPARRAAWLAAGACAVVVALGGPLFGLPAHVTVLALALALPLASVVARAAGETDIAPVSQMGQLAQGVAGMAGARAPGLNVAAGGVASSALATVAVSMWTLKAGHLLGASARRQAVVQLLAVVVGAAVGVPVYLVLARAYGLGSQALPAPSAAQARALAEVASRGLAGLPPGASLATLAGLGVGAGLMLLSRGSWARVVPSAAAMGIGFIMPAHYGVMICLGALACAASRALWPARSERYASALSAGAIAGESLMGVFIAALVALGVLAVPRG